MFYMFNNMIEKREDVYPGCVKSLYQKCEEHKFSAQFNL